ncbi:hypothetical protein ABTX99_00550 [Streptomyces flaveolus]
MSDGDGEVSTRIQTSVEDVLGRCRAAAADFFLDHVDGPPWGRRSGEEL